MNECTFDKDMSQTDHQIRISPLCLYSSLLVSIGFLIAAGFCQSDRWIFILVALLGLFYVFLTARNDRVMYDEIGITMYSILGKPYKISWISILSIDVVEEPLISKKLLIGRVLRIKCIQKEVSSVTIYRFPYRYYLEIDDFLSFSSSHLFGGYDQ